MRLFIAAAVLAGAAAAQGMPTVPKIGDPAFQAAALEAHNVERRAVAVADLVWSPSLAKDAEKWAAKIAKDGAMRHDSRSRHGENLWASTIGAYTIAQMISGWAAEKARYKPGGAHPDVSTTGNWGDVGHYTAMVWSGTTELGCAVARGQKMDFLVCRYNPPGNVTGYAAYDVGKAKAAAAAKPAKAKPAAQPGQDKSPEAARAVPEPKLKPKI